MTESIVADDDEPVAGPAEAASDENPGKRRADPGSFAYLPDRKLLGESFRSLRTKTHQMSMYVMSVRHHGEPNKASMRSLLQIVRATMRSVDRIGCEDDSTLLVCMPSIDESTAQERGSQICRSADAIHLGAVASGRGIVTVGLAQAGPHDAFEAVVSRATELAEQPPVAGIPAVRLYSQTVTA